jgi:NADH-quinone oxidoreductase subunit N
VVGSAVSLGYYLRVVAAMWMRPAPAGAPGSAAVGAAEAYPAIAGGSPEADPGPDAPRASRGTTGPARETPDADGADAAAGPQLEVVAVAVAASAATVFFGIIPSPLFDLARQAGNALGGLF